MNARLRRVEPPARDSSAASSPADSAGDPPSDDGFHEVPELAERIASEPRLTLDSESLAAARSIAAARGVSVTRGLEIESGLGPAEFTYALGAALHYPVARIEELKRWQPAYDLLPLNEALRFRCVLFRDERGLLRLVTDDPFEQTRLAWGDARLRRPFTWALAHRDDLAALLANETEREAAPRPQAPAAAAAAAPPPLTTERATMRLLAAMIQEADDAGASDIHMEVAADGLVVKYRIEGEIEKARRYSGGGLAAALVGRIKMVAGIGDPAAHGGEGRFTATLRGRKLAFRVSVVPTASGDSAVLHLCSARAGVGLPAVSSLVGLGFDAPAVALIRRIAAQPAGLFLVIGPAGAGKSNSLYGLVSETKGVHERLLSVEDPVAGWLPGAMQVPVDERRGFSMARGLAAVLRHDPDRVVVGELADADTARTAVDAALGGMRLLATARANDVFDLARRFDQWGLAAEGYASAIVGFIDQRLVRVSCPRCVADIRPSTALLSASGLLPESVGTFRFRAGRGCEHCRGTGFRGRRVVAEVTAMSDELREQLLDRSSHRARIAAARRVGARALRGRALDLVAAGVTTLQEVNRVTTPD